jgi:hypothetical protein
MTVLLVAGGRWADAIISAACAIAWTIFVRQKEQGRFSKRIALGTGTVIVIIVIALVIWNTEVRI